MAVKSNLESDPTPTLRSEEEVTLFPRGTLGVVGSLITSYLHNSRTVLAMSTFPLGGVSGFRNSRVGRRRHLLAGQILWGRYIASFVLLVLVSEFVILVKRAADIWY
jgi:hypothetical protein